MKPLFTAHTTSLSAKITHLDFKKVEGIEMAWSASVPDVRVDQARNVNTLLAPHDIGFSGGSLAANLVAHGKLPEGSFTGHVGATSKMTTIVSGRERTYSGKLSMGGDFARANSDADLELGHVFANLDDGASRNGSGATADWWAHIDIPHARVRASDGTFIGSAHARFRDFDPVFASIDALQGLPTWIHHAANLSPWDIDVTGAFGKKISISGLDAFAGDRQKPKARVRLTYDNLTEAENMRIAVELGALNVGVEKHGPKVSVVLSDVDLWYRRGAEKGEGAKK
jgi:hypothetical protein